MRRTCPYSSGRFRWELVPEARRRSANAKSPRWSKGERSNREAQEVQIRDPGGRRIRMNWKLG